MFEKYLKHCVLLLAFVVTWSWNQVANACPSCGSGGGDPLTLCPFETWKFYGGYSEQRDLQPITQSGDVAKNYGVLRKKTMTAAFGGKIGATSYMTVAIPHVTNERQDRLGAGVGDVSLVLRYPFILQNFADPLIPQLQFVGGYKFANSRSVMESKDPEFLDVLGTGYPEAKFGFDLWWGMSELKGGIAQTFVMPLAQTYQGVKQRPGSSSQTVLSTATEIMPFMASAGVSLSQSQRREADGETIENSEIKTLSAFGTTSYKYTLLDVFIFTYSANGLGSQNKNSVRSNTYTFAFTKAWI